MLARLLGSVRARLIGLILIGAIPVAVLVGQAAVDLYRDADWAARQRMLLVREGVAASHRVVIEVAEQNLAALARSETVLFGSPEQCDSALAEVLSLQEGRSVNIWMTDGAGRLRCSALPAERGVSYAETSWFTEAIRRNQLVLSGFRIGVMTSRRVIVTALPVRRGRDLLGVIAVGLSLDYFAFRTRGTAAAAEAAMWLMDEGGRSFALTDLATDEALPPTAVWAALRRAPITEINAHSVAGSPFFYGAISLAGDLRLLVGVSSKGFEETARRALIRRIIELGALLAASATLFTALKWAGAAYLVYLGIRLWRAPVAPQAADAPVPAVATRRIFLHAYVVTALNPKSIVFFVAFLPQFLDPAGPVALQLVVFEITFLVLATLNAAAYALLASTARGAIRRPAVQKAVNRAGGTLMIGAGLLAAGWRRAAA